MNKILRLYLAALTCLFGLSARADELTLDGTEPDHGAFAGTHKSFGDSVFSALDEIDDFFGNARTQEQRRKDFFRLGAEMRLRESSAPRFRQRLRAGINLDAISDRLKLVAEGERGRRVEDGRSIDDVAEGSDFLDSVESDSAFTGLRYSILRDAKIDLDFDGGVRFSSGVNPYSRIRASRFFALDEHWSIEPTQFVLWELNKGWGEKTRFDLNRVFGEHMFMRSRSEALFSETSRGVDLYQEFSLFKQTTEKSFSGFMGSVVAYTDPAYSVDEYRLAYRYRSEVAFPWLIVEIEPALAFPDDRDYKVTPEIILRVDIFFDRLKEGKLELTPIKASEKPDSRAERSLQIDMPD